MTITGKQLKQWGLPAGPVYKVVLQVLERLQLHRKQAQKQIKALIADPKAYLHDPDWKEAATLVMPKPSTSFRLNDRGCMVRIFGQDMIEQGAINQIHVASKLPISIQAACMPDGHQGYGLPIGGVLATDNVVIPYAVGVDIGCRMHMTVTDMPASQMEGLRDHLRNALVDNTVFGAGKEINGQVEHSVMEDERFGIEAIKQFKFTAEKQLGTSGGGNHFVEYGSVVAKGLGINEPVLAILSHSGSRGFGYRVAQTYTKIAMASCCLPKEARHLAWLSLDGSAGQEYWEAMNLAGEYAKAGHEVIHARIVKALKVKVQDTIQNHHNFAWKGKARVGTTDEYRDVIIHRKGATPADVAELGIIPGSMSTPTYIVTGRGFDDSLRSSSHGAGRLMSRTEAKSTFTMSDMKKDLMEKGVELIGGSVDECSGSYKDIDRVLAEQREIVDIQGKFMPWMVRMAED